MGCVRSKDAMPTQWRRKERLMICDKCDGKGGLLHSHREKKWDSKKWVVDKLKCEPCNSTGFLTVQCHDRDATMCYNKWLIVNDTYQSYQGRLIVNDAACPGCKDGRLGMTLVKLSDLDLANSKPHPHTTQ